MLRLLLGAVLFTCACNGNTLSVAPTSTPTRPPTASVPPLPFRDAGNWTPWSFAPWQPGLGVPLSLNITVNPTVDIEELCVPDIYQQWGRERVNGLS